MARKPKIQSRLLASMNPTEGELDRAKGWLESRVTPGFWDSRTLEHIMAGYIGRMRDESSTRTEETGVKE